MIVLKVLPDEFSLYQLPKETKLPINEILALPWYTISKTTSELSLLLPSAIQPSWFTEENGKKEEGWRALQVDAQMDFSLVGILASIIDPLRDHGIAVFCISTFDTDYILVKQQSIDETITVLKKQSNIELKSGTSVLEDN